MVSFCETECNGDLTNKFALNDAVRSDDFAELPLEDECVLESIALVDAQHVIDDIIVVGLETDSDNQLVLLHYLRTLAIAFVPLTETNLFSRHLMQNKRLMSALVGMLRESGVSERVRYDLAATLHLSTWNDDEAVDACHRTEHMVEIVKNFWNSSHSGNFCFEKNN